MAFLVVVGRIVVDPLASALRLKLIRWDAQLVGEQFMENLENKLAAFAFCRLDGIPEKFRIAPHSRGYQPY